MTMWMIRAGQGAELYSQFLDTNIVSIGWNQIGNLAELRERNTIVEAVIDEWPEYGVGKARLSGDQLYRFFAEVKEGDDVVTYDSENRIYLLGKISGAYTYDAKAKVHAHSRKVSWIAKVERDRLSVKTRHALGSIATLFEVSEAAATELLGAARNDLSLQFESTIEDSSDKENILKDFQEQSREFIKDKINELDEDAVPKLVAGLLRAMGYKTRISRKGADRGKDIIASPDGFGFEHPRIFVEVKHREAKTDAPQIRSFTGGRHQQDKGLYVSTGGFTKEAHYEIERSSVPVTAMDLEELVDAVIDNYEKFDAEARSILPLTKVWWVS